MSIGGSSSKSDQQEPYFQGTGGVTPQQQSLAQYDYGQQLTEGQGQFEGGGQGGGPIMSTMGTQTAGGAKMGEALNLSSMSDTNQQAEYQAYQNAISIDQQNNATGDAQSGALGSSLGSLAAASGGGSSGSGASAGTL